MDIVYNRQRPRNLAAPSIFLAGPTPRPEQRTVASWRPRALRELARQGFNGTVIVPEPAPGDRWPLYVKQVRWEHEMLAEADCVLFWVPRDMALLPAMTTNIEYGMYMRSGKTVLGAPRHAPHLRYMRTTAGLLNIPKATSLGDAIALAIAHAQASRTESGRIIASPSAWKGRFVRVEHTKWRGKNGEVRRYETVRRNTFGDVVSVFALTRERDVVLVKSFRVPHSAWVIEKPAGLADKKGEDPAELAARELDEETGYGGGTPMQLILRGPFDAGFNSDIMSVYFTRDVVKLHEPRPEGSEDLSTVLVPLDRFVDFVEDPPEGVLVDMKLLAVLPILQSRGLLN